MSRIRQFINDKRIWQVIFIIAIVIVSGLFLFFPEVIDSEYEYSYGNIGKKKENIETVNNTLLTNESSIEQTIQELDDKIREKEEVENEAINIREGINPLDFEKHMPSILISLEQEAIKNGIELFIDYNSIVTSASNPNTGEPDLDGENVNSEVDPDSPEDKDSEDNKNNVTIKDKNEDGKNDTKDNDKEEESSESQVSQNTPDMPMIEGINVTRVPIQIKGSYYNVRNYIKYLDRVGMIEPSSVNLESTWINEESKTRSELSGNIMLNVFHGEVN